MLDRDRDRSGGWEKPARTGTRRLRIVEDAPPILENQSRSTIPTLIDMLRFPKDTPQTRKPRFYAYSVTDFRDITYTPVCDSESRTHLHMIVSHVADVHSAGCQTS